MLLEAVKETKVQIKPAGKVVIFILVLGVALGLFKFIKAYAPGAATQNAVVPHPADLPPRTESNSTGAPVTIPGTGPGATDQPEVRLLGYAWNAQMGMHFAIGGPQTTQGSLMDKHHVNFKFARQDDNGKLQEALVAFATAVSQGESNPTKGANFCTIMGDGSATFLAGLNDALKKLGPEYTAKIVGAIGYSHGEDKFMGPADWKKNPTASRGGLVAGVLRDGDWNIAQKWLGDNGLRTNPDEKTYDPDALNWVNASDYMDASQKYIAGYSEDRPVVRNGKRTGETQHVTVQGVVTWTPGDVIVAQKKGGLVSIVSTKEYNSQMPCVIIGIDKWMKTHRTTVENMLQAIAEGGDAVKSNTAALHRAAEVSEIVYAEKGSDAAYWEKYFKGVVENDVTGQPVDLGGSSANNLADELLTFGLIPGSANLFATTYKVFGDIVVAQYPNLVPSYPPVSAILDTSYIQAVAKRVAPSQAEITEATTKYPIKPNAPKIPVGRRSYDIHFNTGTATIAGDSQRELEKLRNSLLVAGGTTVEIHGHTDSQGNADANMRLSEARAFAVKKWLQSKSPKNFPDERIQVQAHGQTQPLAPNSDESGRAKNRRVEIRLLTTN
ncbi:MAG: Outer rane lipoprotein omp16 precursor [Chthonomonadales bacterium]|nr:Outer rane lipoprotein omp16 precursor [Chthonomonadales bacterium]